MARVKKDFGFGECEYRHCDLPDKKFPKLTDDQKFCCSLHRVKEWNILNPRVKKGRDAINQEPLALGLPLMERAQAMTGTLKAGMIGVLKHGLPWIPPKEILEKERIERDLPPSVSMIAVKACDFINDSKPKGNVKRSFHYTDINGTGKRVFILKKTLTLMLKCDPTTLELNAYSGSTRASSDVSELRKQGFDSECIPCGKSENGLKISRFKLTPEGKEKAIQFFQKV